MRESLLQKHKEFRNYPNRSLIDAVRKHNTSLAKRLLEEFHADLDAVDDEQRSSVLMWGTYVHLRAGRVGDHCSTVHPFRRILSLCPAPDIPLALALGLREYLTPIDLLSFLFLSLLSLLPTVAPPSIVFFV